MEGSFACSPGFATIRPGMRMTFMDSDRVTASCRMLAHSSSLLGAFVSIPLSVTEVETAFQRLVALGSTMDCMISRIVNVVVWEGASPLLAWHEKQMLAARESVRKGKAFRIKWPRWL